MFVLIYITGQLLSISHMLPLIRVKKLIRLDVLEYSFMHSYWTII